MFKQLAAISRSYEAYMTKRGRQMAHRVLMSQDNRTLEDIGISRHELLGGVKNWPWADVNTAKKPVAPPVQNMMSEAKAIRELKSYSDRELSDLGINRGMIADAVRNGRPGIDAMARTGSDDDRIAA